jgi:hypothetical protein
MEAVGEIYGTDRRFRGLWALEFGIGGKGVQRDNDWMEGTYLWSIRCTTTSRKDMEAI